MVNKVRNDKDDDVGFGGCRRVKRTGEAGNVGSLWSCKKMEESFGRGAKQLSWHRRCRYLKADIGG